MPARQSWRSLELENFANLAEMPAARIYGSFDETTDFDQKSHLPGVAKLCFETILGVLLVVQVVAEWDRKRFKTQENYELIL